MKRFHPATFSDGILEFVVKKHLVPHGLILDPFAGVGRVHQLGHDLRFTVGVEIEMPWAEARRGTIQANARHLPFRKEVFDGVFTSPCLAQHHRVLTEDLRWMSSGDVIAGDRLMAFEEHGSPGRTGRNARRRWQRTEVIRSIPRKVKCVRVVLANGDEVVTTPEHPWLACRYSYGGIPGEWVRSVDLMGRPPSGRTRAHQQGARQPYYVSLQVRPWASLRSYEAGWLAGMFDGEGSLSLGVHGSPKLMICQVQGPTMDRAEEWFQRLGYNTNRIARKGPAHRQPVDNLYVTDGFPGILRALGQLRPGRLLDKWATLDVSTRTVEAEKVLVVAVEPAGSVDIQEIETDVGTYIGEGYLHHNCYGNRFADHHQAKDGSLRRSYTHDLQRTLGDTDAALHPDNAGTLHAHQPAYWDFHEAVWREVRRVLKPHAPFVLNVSDHIRRGKIVPVVAEHRALCQKLGFNVIQGYEVPTRRMKFGENAEARVSTEAIIVFTK